MTERKFTVIKGGSSVEIIDAKRTFLSAYVTDTRLMGVVGLYIHWELASMGSISDFHQFFYFDAEEYGFETYKSLIGDSSEELMIIEQALIGGLGGEKVDVTEKEAVFLVQKFVAMNEKLSIPLPDSKNEYAFLLSSPISLTESERKLLDSKLCTPISSYYQLINYFLMRSYALDFEAVKYLICDDLPADSLAEETGATLCKNTIEEYSDVSGISYLCESLIELSEKYKIIVSEIIIDDMKIKSAKKRSSFFVTPAEAAMMLNHAEFITVYELLTEPDEFAKMFAQISLNSMQTIHDNGRLFLEFNKNNNHVSRKVFRLNEDVHGLYYLTDYGQFIVAAYSLAEIQELESNLTKGSVGKYIMPSSKYEFKEPILYEFVQSDFDDFSEFLEFLDTFD